MSLEFDRDRFFFAVSEAVLRCGYSYHRGKKSGKFIKHIKTGSLMASFRVNIQNLRIDCSIAFFHEELYKIFSIILAPGVDADGRWFVCVGALSFPKYSHIWNIKISSFKTMEWHSNQVTGNILQATNALTDLCLDLEKMHMHLMANDEIGEQLHLMVESRIQAALTISIYLSKPETIMPILYNYKNSLEKYGTDEGVIDQAKMFLRKAYQCGYIDQSILDGALQFPKC